ncbi:MAG: TolC family protein [Lentisphaeria bacterium]|nr:TolC family protein [Lentisphaeria bacterium]
MFETTFSRNLLCLCLVSVLLHSALAASPSPPGAVKTVTMARAVEWSLSRNPRIEAGAAAVEAAIARTRQAGFLPNPEIEGEVEDIPLSSEAHGLDGSVYAVRAAVPIELGGKRARRRHAASLETDLSRWDLDAERLDLAAEVKARFIDLLTAQERVRMLTASHELGRKVRDTAAERVQSGKVSPLELTKAEVELTGQRIELRRAERSLATARIALAALWNAAPAEAATLHADENLRQAPQLPDLPTLEAALSKNPDLARWEAEEQVARAIVAQERAARIPDVTLSAGITHERKSGGDFAQFAISLPLPLFDRNQGNIAAALAEVRKARLARRAAEISLRAELAGQWQELQATVEEAKAIEDEVLPGARKAFEAAQQAYRSGKLPYLEVLDAQQTLFDAEIQGLEALSALRQTTVLVERLVGGSLEKTPRRK